MGRCRSRSSVERTPTFSRAAARWGPTPFAYWTGPWRSMPGGPIIPRERGARGPDRARTCPGPRTRASPSGDTPNGTSRYEETIRSVEDVGQAEDPLDVSPGADTLLPIERAGHALERRVHDPALPHDGQSVLDPGPESQAPAVAGHVRVPGRRSGGVVLHEVRVAQIVESGGQIRADPVTRPELPTHVRAEVERRSVLAGIPEAQAGPETESVRAVVADPEVPTGRGQ